MIWLPVYKLTGHCKRCGECCRKNISIFSNPIKELIEWAQARSRIRYQTDKVLLFESYCPCPNLIESEDGNTSCKIQEKKPLLCSAFPDTLFAVNKMLGLTPDMMLLEGCGFRFEGADKKDL